MCLERNKSLSAVAQAALWHYSQQRGMALMLTNTGERGSFTTHPLSTVPILHRQQGHLSFTGLWSHTAAPHQILQLLIITIITSLESLKSTCRQTVICQITDIKAVVTEAV